MTAISERMPEVDVSYLTANGNRTVRHFKSAHVANSFYVRQDKLGNKPFVYRSENMASATKTEAAKKTTKATKKGAKRKVAKTVKKSLKKPTATKAAKKKSTKPPTPKRKDGLRKPQVRILEYLAKQRKPSDRNEIAEGASVDVATLVEYLGSHDSARRAANDKKHFPSLISLKHVKVEQEDIDGKDVRVYSITATGKKAL